MKHISHTVGMLIKINCHIWASEDPPNVYVWCALQFESVSVGPYFFKNDDGTGLSPSTLSIVVIRKLTFFCLPLENMWFQQDTLHATCCTTRANMALLPEIYSGRVISRRDDIKWPPRSWYLTSLDFFVGLPKKPSTLKLL